MKRYNLFYQIHKGLRTMLYETAIGLQQTDFCNEEETDAIAERISVPATRTSRHHSPGFVDDSPFSTADFVV